MTYRQTERRTDGQMDRLTDGRTTKAIACHNFRLAICFYWLPCKKCVQTFFAFFVLLTRHPTLSEKPPPSETHTHPTPPRPPRRPQAATVFQCPHNNWTDLQIGCSLCNILRKSVGKCNGNMTNNAVHILLWNIEEISFKDRA